MKRFLAVLLCLVLGSGPALAAGFGDWAVLIVAGDDHSHSGDPSDVFDNARRDLAKAFESIGFSRTNIAQFSVQQASDAQATDPTAIANSLWDLSGRAAGGCLIYFTSHGSPDGILTGDHVLAPDKLAAMVNNACGAKPSVIVMSSCFSGIFVPALEGPNRMVFTAARPDRTSFGCSNDFKYTFFDQCFLQSVPSSSDFPGLAALTTQCVARREHQLGAAPPSEPQLAVGAKVVNALRWR